MHNISVFCGYISIQIQNNNKYVTLLLLLTVCIIHAIDTFVYCMLPYFVKACLSFPIAIADYIASLSYLLIKVEIICVQIWKYSV